jgi:hypothetical protein
MDQNQLFTTMFKDDGEGQKLMLVPGADELMTQFEQKFTAIVYTMFQVGLKVNIFFIYKEGNSIYRLVFFRKKKYEIMKLMFFGYVLMKLKMKIHVELQLL